MNNQKPEPRADGDGSTLDVHSLFFTIQGEGPFAGHRAIFVRLAGCNLQCPGCDTEYTQNRGVATIEQIVNGIRLKQAEHNAAHCLVVITGGEPLRQSIGRLCEQIYDRLGSEVQIESNGVFGPDKTLEFLLMTGKATLVVSPKTTRINKDAAELASAFKYVLDHRSIDPADGLPIKALEHPAATGVARPPSFRSGVPVYVNPYDVKDATENAMNLQAVSLSAMKFGYIAGVQLHKYLDLE